MVTYIVLNIQELSLNYKDALLCLLRHVGPFAVVVIQFSRIVQRPEITSRAARLRGAQKSFNLMCLMPYVND